MSERASCTESDTIILNCTDHFRNQRGTMFGRVQQPKTEADQILADMLEVEANLILAGA